MSDRLQVPYDAAAERALAGAALLWREVCDLVVRDVPANAFYQPQVGAVVDAVQGLRARGDAVDGTTVRAEMVANGDESNGGLLLELQAEAASPGAARRLVGVVLDCWARRLALAAAIAAQRAVLDRSKPLSEAAEIGAEMIDALTLQTMRLPPSMNVEEFLAVADDPEDWIVPGLLERMDRCIVTAGEGAGKSTWLRTFAAQLAAGMHPFTGCVIRPGRVLLIDLENSERQIRRGLRPVWNEVKRQRFAGGPENLLIEARQQGLDLLHSATDVRWLHATLEANKPDVVITGPIYKLAGTSHKEEEAAHVARVFDDIRVRFGCALLLEAHAPKGEAAGPHGRSLQPYGASLWLRWPEFGFGLALDPDSKGTRFELKHWRGPRERREWPRAIYRTGQPIPWGVLPGDEARTPF